MTHDTLLGVNHDALVQIVTLSLVTVVDVRRSAGGGFRPRMVLVLLDPLE